jgi:hypothetical protein
VLGFSEGSIIAAELGTVVVGGLFTSTFLTLIVVPVVYSLLDGVRTRLSRKGDSVDDGARSNAREKSMEGRDDLEPVGA